MALEALFSENTGLDHTIQLGIVLNLEIHVAAFSHKSANWGLTLLEVMAMSKNAALPARTPLCARSGAESARTGTTGAHQHLHSSWGLADRSTTCFAATGLLKPSSRRYLVWRPVTAATRRTCCSVASNSRYGGKSQVVAAISQSRRALYAEKQTRFGNRGYKTGIADFH